MINTSEALELFSKECKRICGEDFKLKPGDTLAGVFNNCVMVFSLDEARKNTIDFIPDVIKIDESLDIYCDSDNGA